MPTTTINPLTTDDYPTQDPVLLEIKEQLKVITQILAIQDPLFRTIEDQLKIIAQMLEIQTDILTKQTVTLKNIQRFIQTSIADS